MAGASPALLAEVRDGVANGIETVDPNAGR
jgi:hypothetical protein